MPPLALQLPQMESNLQQSVADYTAVMKEGQKSMELMVQASTV